MDAETRASVLAEARSWIGTPYHHKGRAKGIGVDCGGMLYEVYAACGFCLKPFPAEYPADWTLHQGGSEIYLDFISDYVTPSKRPVIGAPVLFRIGRRFGHGGIVSENGVIHSYGRTAFGQVMESSWQFFQPWRERMFFDVKDL